MKRSPGLPISTQLIISLFMALIAIGIVPTEMISNDARTLAAVLLACTITICATLKDTNAQR